MIRDRTLTGWYLDKMQNGPLRALLQWPEPSCVFMRTSGFPEMHWYFVTEKAKLTLDSASKFHQGVLHYHLYRVKWLNASNAEATRWERSCRFSGMGDNPLTMSFARALLRGTWGNSRSYQDLRTLTGSLQYQCDKVREVERTTDSLPLPSQIFLPVGKARRNPGFQYVNYP